ncbi:MAG: HipA N-terminal domain-containing protein [Candidatus Marinimicrobia bacterium]|nr:HipA N-terminal domain-containing protein [Candidatus Neomarinimicrobiota bacterium]MBL7138123.1 HipA N-terminal domain-containing protein [Bacteroidales bacterium]
MKSAEVYYNGELAGILTEESRNSYRFRYNDAWLINDNKPPISLTMPKNRQEYEDECLFPFFFNMLSEGFNRKIQSRLLKIDEKDYFGLLTATAQYDTIGAITIKPAQQHEDE